MLERRAFLGALASGLFGAPPSVWAQATGKVWRVGILSDSRPPTSDEGVQAAGFASVFGTRLRELGYVEGENLTLVWRRIPEGTAHQLDDLAADLVRLKVDVIVATYPAAVFSARRATTTIPIIMVHTPDPVRLGLVASLAHPGGNITGATSLSGDLTAKQLELLKQMLPRISKIAVVWNPDNPWHSVAVKGLEGNARSSRVQLQGLQVRAPDASVPRSRRWRENARRRSFSWPTR
jgi:putative ABC transport system substrate-binding protein